MWVRKHKTYRVGSAGGRVVVVITGAAGTAARIIVAVAVRVGIRVTGLALAVTVGIGAAGTVLGLALAGADGGVLAVLLHDGLVLLVVLAQGELHPVQGTSVAGTELLEGCLIGQTGLDKVLQIAQQTDVEARDAAVLIDDVLALGNRLVQRLEFGLDLVKVLDAHGIPDGLDVRLKGFEGPVLGRLDDALFVAGIGIGLHHPPVGTGGTAGAGGVGGRDGGIIRGGIVRRGIGTAPELAHGTSMAVWVFNA